MKDYITTEERLSLDQKHDFILPKWLVMGSWMLLMGFIITLRFF